MEISEICERFRHAKDKQTQIIILSNLADIDKETVIEVLKDHGLCVRKAKCRKCGMQFDKYLTPICPDCLDKADRMKAERDERRRAAEKKILQNEALRLSLLRQIAAIDIDNKRCREIIKG